jgi:hypothetical protein
MDGADRGTVQLNALVADTLCEYITLILKTPANTIARDFQILENLYILSFYFSLSAI